MGGESLHLKKEYVFDGFRSAVKYGKYVDAIERLDGYRYPPLSNKCKDFIQSKIQSVMLPPPPRSA